MPGLFARLYRYRPRVERSSREDFFTEALAGVLDSDPRLCAEFARRITRAETELVDVRVSTQETLETGDRVDLLLDARDAAGRHHVAVLEHKIEAGEGANQLARYECWLLRQPECTKTLAYVTPHARSSFRPSSADVTFREVRWFEVFEWIENWVDRQGTSEASGVVLGTELLDLMEEWRMAMKLSATDLAVATLYKTSVEDRLQQILDEVRAHMPVAQPWPRRTSSLHRLSPWIDAEGQVYLEYGFDFGRQGDDWHVTRLGLPSAYFAAKGKGGEQFNWGALPAPWVEPPEAWAWRDGLRVKQISSATVQGQSLHRVLP